MGAWSSVAALTFLRRSQIVTERHCSRCAPCSSRWVALLPATHTRPVLFALLYVLEELATCARRLRLRPIPLHPLYSNNLRITYHAATSYGPPLQPFLFSRSTPCSSSRVTTTSFLLASPAVLSQLQPPLNAPITSAPIASSASTTPPQPPIRRPYPSSTPSVPPPLTAIPWAGTCSPTAPSSSLRKVGCSPFAALFSRNATAPGGVTLCTARCGL